MTEHLPRCPLQSEEHAQLLLSYCARQLDPASTATLQRHIELCPACRRALESQQLVWEALDTWDHTPVSDDFDDQIFRRLQGSERPEWAARLAQWSAAISWKPALPAAAIFALWIIAYPTTSDPVLQPDAEQVALALEDLDMLQQLHLPAK
jgi:anti-sigma factor RsiW